MANSSPELVSPRRPSAKRELILRTLRREIIEGIYAPGKSLPTRTDLTQRFDASTVTIQAAMDQLIRDGFVVARGRNGTFATDFPPHLHHYGLAFTSDPLGTTPHIRSPFWKALAQQAARVDWEDRRVRFSVYHQIERGPGSEDYTRLLADVRAQRLAGIILTRPWEMKSWAQELYMPVVMFGSDVPAYGARDYSYHAIDLDMQAFVDRAVEHLAERGARRVGFLLSDEVKVELGHVKAAAASRGLEAREEWMMGINLRVPRWVRQAVLAMFRRPAGERPQGLVVGDDTLVEPVAAALVELGVRVPEELHVVAHGNFPLESPSPLPFTRLGFSVRDALRTATQIINLARNPQGGEGPPEMTRVAPIFESEFKESTEAVAVPPRQETASR